MKALVVDDDLEVRTALKAIIGRAGYDQVDTVPSGGDALVLVLLDTYDLITLDLHFADVSGLDVLAALRSANPEGIIAIVSGHTDEVTGRFIRMANVVIPKPFDGAVIQTVAEHTKRISESFAAIRNAGKPLQAPKRLGEILIAKGYLTSDHLHEAIRVIGFNPQKNQMVGEILVGFGYVTAEQVEEALNEQKAHTG